MTDNIRSVYFFSYKITPSKSVIIEFSRICRLRLCIFIRNFETLHTFLDFTDFLGGWYKKYCQCAKDELNRASFFQYYVCVTYFIFCAILRLSFHNFVIKLSHDNCKMLKNCFVNICFYIKI